MISTNTQLLELVSNAPADIQKRLTQRTLDRGEELISQGDSPHYIYIVKDGLVKVAILEANGKEFSFGFLGKGELIGEVELFLQQPFACTVEALHPTQAYRLSGDTFLSWLDCDNALNKLVLKEMAFRLYTLSTRTSYQMLYPIEYAVMKCVYIFQENQENNIEMSKTDLADYLGITLRSLNRTLNSLNEKGILLFANNTLSIQSEKRLKQELIRYEYS